VVLVPVHAGPYPVRLVRVAHGLKLFASGQKLPVGRGLLRHHDHRAACRHELLKPEFERNVVREIDEPGRRNDQHVRVFPQLHGVEVLFGIHDRYLGSRQHSGHPVPEPPL